MRRLVLIVVCMLPLALTARANDSAAETAAGGIRLRQERRVAMEKERLSISEDLVRVEYEFRNTSSEPVTSEVAFPVPPFEYRFLDPGAPRDFADFKVWVNGQSIPVAKEVRAFVNDLEVTVQLSRAGITPEQFGRFDPDNEREGTPDEITKLPPAVRDELVHLGALRAGENDPSLYWPEWSNHVTCHWTQTFPPGETVRVKHEYRPVVGFEGVQLESFAERFPDACMDQKTYGFVKQRLAEVIRTTPDVGDYVYPKWVKYILTTANTWQGPIRDFELVLKRPEGQVVTLCWDGKIEQVDETTFRAHETDFVPTRELTVYFIQIGPS